MTKKLTGCPAWLKLSEDKTSFVLVPERAETVRRIFELSVSGLGGYTIAKQLNEKKVPAFGPSSKWDQSTLHNMLSNRATIGEHQPKQYRKRRAYPVGDPIPDYYPKVIEESLFNAAQAARQKNLASGRGRKGRFITNLFPGILTCVYCGSAVKFRSNGADKSLICSRLIDGHGCFRRAWSCRDFEKHLFDFIRTYANSTPGSPDQAALQELVQHVLALEGPNLYEARIGIALSIKTRVAELRVAAAGPSPLAVRPDARIRRDVPGRYFEIRFQGGTQIHVVRPT
jgi:hypothetical protein